MFYDLNEHTENATGVDTFILSGKVYEIGEIPLKTKLSISDIDSEKNIIDQVRSIIVPLISKWNDDVPELSDAEVEAIYKIVIQKLNV